MKMNHFVVFFSKLSETRLLSALFPEPGHYGKAWTWLRALVIKMVLATVSVVLGD